MTEAEPKFRWVALVPMRHHSERVPGKNYRPLAGKPLYSYILDTLIEVETIDQIVVDTDSDIIWQGISKNYPEVQLIERPQHLRAGEIPMNDVLLHDAEQVPSSFYLQTHSTNPLLKAETVTKAIEAFEEEYPEKDSLFGVTRLQTRLWTPEGKPLNHDPSELLRTQDLPPVYEENSCLYLFERSSFLDLGNRIGSKISLFQICYPENLDIDTEMDFDMVEYVLGASSVHVSKR